MESAKYKLDFYHLAPKENRLIIEQAPASRLWMDQTPGGYAYRCLPMSYANRHGWCVRLKEDVEVIWDGSTNADGTTIICGREQNGFRMADNGTGNGIITFHLNAIPRTSPDFNLWIMGAPNLVISGASPLSGVVETDWAFGTPTSNWKITEKNKIITFKAGDPVIFFIPIHKSELELFNINHYEIHDDPEISKHFEEHARWRQNLDLDKKEVFGKMYRKGIRADGTKPDFEHLHKTRLYLDKN